MLIILSLIALFECENAHAHECMHPSSALWMGEDGLELASFSSSQDLMQESMDKIWAAHISCGALVDVICRRPDKYWVHFVDAACMPIAGWIAMHKHGLYDACHTWPSILQWIASLQIIHAQIHEGCGYPSWIDFDLHIIIHAWQMNARWLWHTADTT